MKTVRFFADQQQDAEASEHLDAVKSRFDGIASENAGQYRVQVYDEATGVEVACTNLELAEAWLYGDVVHADTAKHFAAMSFGIGERYAAAVGVYMNTALITKALLTVVQQLQQRDPSICSVSSITSPVVADIKDGQLYSMAFSDPKAE
ncbi:hypothetical protein [Clavibacter sp. Sh2088]|uniref:hypothetical protein n=1 Tax=Clavibacter sp. Sh2088 TaxID=3397676 RepID=UPI0039DF3201